MEERLFEVTEKFTQKLYGTRSIKVVAVTEEEARKLVEKHGMTPFGIPDELIANSEILNNEIIEVKEM